MTNSRNENIPQITKDRFYKGRIESLENFTHVPCVYKISLYVTILTEIFAILKTL